MFYMCLDIVVDCVFCIAIGFRQKVKIIKVGRRGPEEKA